jgi:hypothetical protein
VRHPRPRHLGWPDAIRERWIPRLEQALAEVTLAIEEQELADAARLRLASGPGNRR